MLNMDDLRVRQLDDALARHSALRRRPAPETGWAKTIREALGMSLRQLALRTGLSKTAVASAEAGEARGTVQLNTLSRIADGLDCDLVYALVPRTSLGGALEAQAQKRAHCLVQRIADSMELEAQGVAPHETGRQASDLATELLRNRTRDFWDV